MAGRIAKARVLVVRDLLGDGTGPLFSGAARQLRLAASIALRALDTDVRWTIRPYADA